MNFLIALALAGKLFGTGTEKLVARLPGVEPQLAVAGSNVFVGFGAKDQTFVARSYNAGESFNVPVRLPTRGRLALGMRRGPRLAASTSAVVVLAVYGQKGGGEDGDVMAWRSLDQGRTWLGPSVVSDVPGSASEGLHAVAVSPQGKFASVWLDNRSGGAEIWLSSSSDAGKTWSKNIRVYRSPDGNVCECCHPTVAFGPKGEAYVMFRNWLGGARDMYVCKSNDANYNFGPAQKLGQGTWPLNACPMDGGTLAVGADGKVTAIWRREGTVFISGVGSTESKIGPGTQPWVAVSGREHRSVWQQGGQILTQARDEVTTVLGGGNNPVVASVRGTFVASWTESNGGIVVKKLR